MLRVVIIGYGEMFTNLIAASLDANVKIVGVLRKETVKYNPLIKTIKDIINPSFDYNYLKSYNLPEITNIKSVNSKKFKNKLLKLNPDIILVGSWGEKFSKEIYSIPKIATINAHPSLLPKYRGPNPYFWVIKNQEKTTGITFHLIDDGFDTGAILAQEEVPILENDTGMSLKQRVVLKARATAYELLKTLQEDIIIPLKQREDKACYYSHPENLGLNFNNSATENFALIRAAYPWRSAYFYHNETVFKINPHKVFIEENKTTYTSCGTIITKNPNNKSISVLCGDGKVLKMNDILIWDKTGKFFTKNYIKNKIFIGNIL